MYKCKYMKLDSCKSADDFFGYAEDRTQDALEYFDEGEPHEADTQLSLAREAIKRSIYST